VISRRGFSLFEVAVSILVVAVAVLGFALLLPAALRTHEQSRFSLYANAQALSLIESFATVPVANGGLKCHLEAPNPWDIPAGRRGFDPDLEIKSSAIRGPLRPVPLDVAYRIDSAGDEIRALLDAGGYLYYSNPRAVTQHRVEAPDDPRPPNETIKLLVGVHGAAQVNAVANNPWKAWPYYQPYPSPPGRKAQPTHASAGWEGDSYEADADPDLARLWETDLAATDGSWDYDRGANKSGIGWYNWLGTQHERWGKSLTGMGWLQAKGQFALALWYAWRKGLPADLLFGRADMADVDAAYRNGDWVQAQRFLAHAAMCMTRHFALEATPARPGQSMGGVRTGSIWWPPPVTGEMYGTPASPGLLAGIAIPGNDDPSLFSDRSLPVPNNLTSLLSILPAGLGTPFSSLAPPSGHPNPLPGHFYLTHDMIVNYHETSLAMVMRHTAEWPYDLQVPRPLNRMIMMDHPLMEFDLIPDASHPILSGQIAGVSNDTNIAASVKALAVQAQQWRPLAAESFVNPGRDLEGVVFDWPTLEGNRAHFTLTQRFAATERAREMVFWAVPWTDWEDWETAPSAPVDASRYFRVRPDVHPAGKMTDVYMGTPWRDYTANSTAMWFDGHQWSARNPEKPSLFAFPVAGLPTDSNVLKETIGADNRHDQNQQEAWAHRFSEQTGYRIADQGYRPVWSTLGDGTPVSDPKMVFSGRYGADRNGNQLLDRGTLPASVRLRATEVARFVYYDPRLTLTVR
jgi:hypothetical protein